MNAKGCPSSPITATASIPPWERDRSVIRSPAPSAESLPARRNPPKHKKPKRKRRQLPSRGPEGYREYMRSKTWRKKRRKVLRRAEFKCEECGATGHLEVHHLTYKRFGQEPLSDLKALCFDCHQVKHEDKYLPMDSVSKAFREALRNAA